MKLKTFDEYYFSYISSTKDHRRRVLYAKMQMKRQQMVDLLTENKVYHYEFSDGVKIILIAAGTLLGIYLMKI